MTYKNRATIRPAGLMLIIILLGACASQGPFVRHQGDLTTIEIHFFAVNLIWKF